MLKRLGLIVICLLLMGNVYTPVFESERKKLASAFSKMGEPGEGDWLRENEEAGQNFAEWLGGNPTRPDRLRNVIYVLPIGPFDQEDTAMLEDSVAFLRLFFQPLKVAVMRGVSVDESIPENAWRMKGGHRQADANVVLDEVVKPKLLKNAACVIGLMAEDLYVEDSTFVFGRARYRQRVGVWSIHWLKTYSWTQPILLERTVRVAVHEIGHMFSMYHCTAYECGMSGMNSISEGDRRPLAFCPECVSKLWHLTGADPVERYRELEAFCHRKGLEQRAEFFADLAKRLAD